MKKYKFVCTLGLGHVLLQMIVWIILTVITFGAALPFFAYYFLRMMINRTEVHAIS